MMEQCLADPMLWRRHDGEFVRMTDWTVFKRDYGHWPGSRRVPASTRAHVMPVIGWRFRERAWLRMLRRRNRFGHYVATQENIPIATITQFGLHWGSRRAYCAVGRRTVSPATYAHSYVVGSSRPWKKTSAPGHAQARSCLSRSPQFSAANRKEPEDHENHSRPSFDRLRPHRPTRECICGYGLPLRLQLPVRLRLPLQRREVARDGGAPEARETR